MKHKKILSMGLPILLAVLCFSVLLWQLYLHDNKYTHPGPQPIAGMLYLEEAAVDGGDVHFLARGWQVYPDVLLTPADFADGKTPAAFMQTVTLGSSSTFVPGATQGQMGGSATYRMTLQLPQGMRSYTLVLPEIYSAYRLYIGGREYAGLGNPDPAQFSSRIARKSVSFSAEGTVELLIAVTNRSHFSSGMTYPPLLGLSEPVGRMESIRLTLGIITFTLALLCALLSLYLIVSFHGRREKRPKLFVCTAACVTLTYAYPLLFGFGSVTGTLWYGVELFAIYGGYLFTVMLQNEICDMGDRAKKYSTAILTAFCAAALLYGLLPVYPLWLVKLFGLSATVVKLFTAGYLFYCAVTAALWERSNSPLLLFCNTAFGVSIVFDRLLPGWEPIYGGWVTEYGYAVMVLGLGIVLWQELSEGYRFKLTFTEEKRQLTRQVDMQKAHYMELTEQIETTIRYHHDERHHLRTIQGILTEKDYPRLEQYLREYDMSATPKTVVLLCKNLIIDAMLRYYKNRCEENGIQFLRNIFLPSELPLSDVELSILFGNLLENAFDGAMEKGCENPFMSVNAKVSGGRLQLLVENSFVTRPRQKGERLLSAKHGGYGIGTQSVRSLVESYGGQCTFLAHETFFSVTASLDMEKIGK